MKLGMTAYYNEIDPHAAQWLRNLIAEGLIAPGDVDERSIEDVRPDELAGYTQCHFFAGIGGWSYALRLAGWPDDRPVWTGSCPCQPFSAAGKGRGVDDERHLWPAFRWLIDQCRPPAVFGEQVASRLGRDWLAGVRADLEALGYGVGAADLCAAGVGAPHIRQRLWWVADSNGRQRDGLTAGERREHDGAQAGWQQGDREPECSGSGGGLADSDSQRHDQQQRVRIDLGDGRSINGLGNAQHPRLEGHARNEPDSDEPRWLETHTTGSTATPGSDSWSDFIWLPCADGKSRRIKPGIEPLANGVSGRVGLLRGYGNAIVPQVAAAFIRGIL